MLLLIAMEIMSRAQDYRVSIGMLKYVGTFAVAINLTDSRLKVENECQLTKQIREDRMAKHSLNDNLLERQENKLADCWMCRNVSKIGQQSLKCNKKFLFQNLKLHFATAVRSCCYRQLRKKCLRWFTSMFVFINS